ncbi:hypothetical protein THAOC_11486 [Thalassiosira oceanica]|uniref:Peptidase M16C associated domain-containing protein n=1 Tax=Thalassiosira oceanica TaxID=159749 RepID=K0SQ49_THAOC|nr:hypothetical protein THAOC_11486 [Thalassiosira oceanica]|eukprot:EJK67475.1 hypothetical protein THAOC_11486 [Thalassiosira oceanica]
MRVCELSALTRIIENLKTFLNAMTYPDRTVYPVASRNRADFRNLMDVYLDAVFHPRAVEEEGWWVLRQEGWRYDVVGGDDDGDEADGGVSLPGERKDFEYKGVVYSEMKGAYSDPEGLMDRVAQGLLFPDSPYRYDSGGDPAVIPTLTREEFVGFHRRYYHPTNARLFVAGDESDVYDALSRASSYMTPFGYNPQSRKDSVIPYQQRTFKKPVYERRPYSAPGGDGGGGGGGHMLQVTWLLNTQPLDGVTELAWIVLDHLLLGRPSSPLRKALEDSGLGEETIGGGLDDELSQSTFAIGMRGVGSRRDVSRLEDLIMDTLAGLDSGGFTDDEIDSTMNTIEFRLREGGGGLRGMEVFLGSLTKWNYDLDPRDALVYEDSLAGLRDEVDRTGSNVFQRLIRDALIGNSHRVVLELYPSATYEDELAQDTRAQLARSQSRMTDDEYGSVVEEGKRLKELQGTEESPEVLATNPALSISDIDTLPIEYPVKVEANAFKSGIVAVSHEVESSGIAYVDFGMDISMVPFEDAALLPSLITELHRQGHRGRLGLARDHVGQAHGVGGRQQGPPGDEHAHDAIPERQVHGRKDPGIVRRVHEDPHGRQHGRRTGHRPERAQVEPQFEEGEGRSNLCFLLSDSDRRGRRLPVHASAHKKSTNKKSSIASRGHSFADRRIRGRYSVRNYISEKIYGVSSIRSYDSVLESLDGDWDQFALLVRGVLRKILDGSREGMVLNLTGDEAVLDAATEHAEEFLTNGLPLDLGRTPDVTPDFRSSPTRGWSPPSGRWRRPTRVHVGRHTGQERRVRRLLLVREDGRRRHAVHVSRPEQSGGHPLALRRRGRLDPPGLRVRCAVAGRQRRHYDGRHRDGRESGRLRAERKGRRVGRPDQVSEGGKPDQQTEVAECRPGNLRGRLRGLREEAEALEGILDRGGRVAVGLRRLREGDVPDQNLNIT